MGFAYFDAHTHAQFAAFDADRNAVLARTRSGGVRMVNAGTNSATSASAIALAAANPDLCWATVGLHPTHAYESGHHDAHESAAGSGMESFDVEKFRALAAHPKVVAIGECGLDYFRIEDGGERIKKKQREAFVAQIELAHEIRKPLVIHCRAAFSDLIGILKAHSSKLKADVPGLIHFFSGTTADAERLLAMGFYFTFGGVITFVRDYDGVIKMIPPDRILSETDAPYVAPAPYRGKRNEPAYVVEVVKKLAELKGISVEEIAAQVLKNAERIFGIRLEK